MAPPHLFRTEAVVLRRHDLGEADRVVTLYTAQLGKLRAVAKGVRRTTSRLGGHLELFTHSQVNLARGRNLDVLTGADTISSFIGLREDLWRASQAYYAAEMLDLLTEDHSENAALFDLLVITLDRIATGSRPDLALQLFQLQSLALLGYSPELRHCVRCRQALAPVENAFSSTGGGVLCPTCRGVDPNARSLSPNALKILRLFQDGSWKTLNRLRIDQALRDEIEPILRTYVQYVAETQLKSAGFVASLERQGLATGR